VLGREGAGIRRETFYFLEFLLHLSECGLLTSSMYVVSADFSCAFLSAVSRLDLLSWLPAAVDGKKTFWYAAPSRADFFFFSVFLKDALPCGSVLRDSPCRAKLVAPPFSLAVLWSFFSFLACRTPFSRSYSQAL